MITVKKYANRRLYDTTESRYITLEELGEKVRDGHDVQVLDAKTGDDLTGPTLTQIILDGRGAARLLPVALLTQLVRLQDELLAEFFGKFLSHALELYLSSKRGVQAMAPYLPFGTLPLGAADAWARMVGASALWASAPSATAGPAPGAPAPAEEPAARRSSPDDIAELRRELEALKRTVSKQRR